MTSNRTGAANTTQETNGANKARLRIERRDMLLKAKLTKTVLLLLLNHGAATLDAYSTRRLLVTGHYREMNPLVRPFASSWAIYPAAQLGPAIADILAAKHVKHTRLASGIMAGVSTGSAVRNFTLLNPHLCSPAPVVTRSGACRP